MKVAGVSLVAFAALIAVPGVASGQVEVPSVVEDTVESVQETAPPAGEPQRSKPAPRAQAPAPAAEGPASKRDRASAPTAAAPRSASASSPSAPATTTRSAGSQARAAAAAGGGGEAKARAHAAQAEGPVAEPEVQEFSGVADPESAPAQQGDSRLPFTGFQLLPLLVLGSAALLAGLVLRRHA